MKKNDKENIMESIESPITGSHSTNIYKSALITVDLGQYQNIKLYSSYSITPYESGEKEDINHKIWISRGEDLKYGLKLCLRKLARMEVPVIKECKNEGDDSKEKCTSAIIRKSCEVTLQISPYQSVKFSSGEEWSVEYYSEDERKVIESEKWDEIASDLDSGIKLFFGSIGKKTDAPDRFAKLCQQKIEAKKNGDKQKNTKA